MSDTAPAIPLFGDAYLADTRHLSLEEHGAYLQLMMIAWRSPKCALPDDDARLARMLGITAGRWAKIKGDVMAFWTLGEDGWTQKRLTKERAFVEKKRKNNSGAAKSRWEKQVVENKGTEECERICERNAPPPPPNIAAKAASARDEQIVAVAHDITAGTPLSSPDPGRIAEQQSLVRGWIEAGADPELIRQTVRDRLASTNASPRSLRWFDGAVRDAIAAKTSASTSPELASAVKMAAGILGRNAA